MIASSVVTGVTVALSSGGALVSGEPRVPASDRLGLCYATGATLANASQRSDVTALRRHHELAVLARLIHLARFTAGAAV